MTRYWCNCPWERQRGCLTFSYLIKWRQYAHRLESYCFSWSLCQKAHLRRDWLSIIKPQSFRPMRSEQLSSRAIKPLVKFIGTLPLAIRLFSFTRSRWLQKLIQLICGLMSMKTSLLTESKLDWQRVRIYWFLHVLIALNLPLFCTTRKQWGLMQLTIHLVHVSSIKGVKESLFVNHGSE